jgi:hypothetical protein
MVGSGQETRKHLLSRGHHVLALAGALLLASGLAQLQAQTMGPSSGPMQEVDQGFANGLMNNPNLVFVPVLKEGKGAALSERTGQGHAMDSGQYQPKTDAVELRGGCKKGKNGGCSNYIGKDKVQISGDVSTEALGVSAKNPITEVIPMVFIKVGDGSCWWSCSSPGGSSGCKCTCVGGGSCPQQ